MAKLYGVAISVIRNRGFQDIMPNSVFSAEGEANEREYWRLEHNGHIREASDDETKLYEAKVADGETQAIMLGATPEEFALANQLPVGSVNTGGVLDPLAAELAAQKAAEEAEAAAAKKAADEAEASKTGKAKTTSKKDEEI